MPVPSYPGQILPGDLGLLLGQKAVPGFFGNVASGAADLANNNASTLAPNGVSRTIAINPRVGNHPATQRQLVWRVRLITGTAGLNLQVSTDGANDWTTIDTYTGTTDSVRTITGDYAAAGGPAAQSTSKILSSARFVRVQDTGSGTTAWVDIVTY